MPLYVRPVIYYLYRIVFQLGVLDGREGRVFHFLQAYWFRLIVDIKISELQQRHKKFSHSGAGWFVVKFVALFLLFYYFNILYFSLVSAGPHVVPFLANYLDYISGLRWLLLHAGTAILNLAGYTSICNSYDLLVVGHGSIELVYSCLGLGVISFFTAFVLAFPGTARGKLIFLFCGVVFIELLNIFRFVLLALFWTKAMNKRLDHHLIFNSIIYLVIAISLYFWVKKAGTGYATN